MQHKPPTHLQGITDLTVIAQIKPGLIEGIFESRSYAWRLRMVLHLLDAARRTSREADVQANPFIDHVGRLRGIHCFRFAVLPGDRQLLLNVTFDGGWEPYLRLIWDPLGTMLDLIFCHCEGYPLAAAYSYDEYIRWIRDHEVPSQFFYVDSGGSVADQAFQTRLEALQRTSGHRPGADLRAVQLALEAPQPPQPTLATTTQALRNLKGLYALSPFFGLPRPTPATSVPLDDGAVLLRFAQNFLPDLRSWYAQGLFDPGQRFDALAAAHALESRWLMAPQWTRPKKRDRALPPALTDVQAGILNSFKTPAGRHGRNALVLARVTNPGDARRWLQAGATASSAGGQGLIGDGTATALSDAGTVCTVAITFAGLQALEIPEPLLAALPGEFMQGMEARAGLLGDVRTNHPQQWNRPRKWSQPARPASAPLDLTLVHLVFQLRTSESDSEQGSDRTVLLGRLSDWITRNLGPSSGIEALAVEPGWSRPSVAHEPATRDHFDYVDGVSQPTLEASAANQYWDDAVKTGEILLGWTNDRGDGPLETPGEAPPPVSSAPPAEWLELGTFLVVRKIRQHVERFNGIVDRAAAELVATCGLASIDQARELVRSKLMGRSSDGSSIIAQRGQGINDFDYRSDTDGAQCPFASHVRRANPRAAPPKMRPPRIVRRGMGYGPSTASGKDKPADDVPSGVLFMAYNASIAEQFEVIQRWLTGGNSSGVSSAEADPFLGVPRLGEPTLFRFAHGDKVVRVDLGDQPICNLEWGLYAFVPSLALLRNWDAKTTTARANQAIMRFPPVRTREADFAKGTPDNIDRQVKAEFEDDTGRKVRWDMVRHAGGVEKIGSIVMVGSVEAVTTVLHDDGSTYSVSGYGKRMGETLGSSPFGEDDAAGPGQGHARDFVPLVKAGIAESVTEAQAHAAAFEFVTTKLARQLTDFKALGHPHALVDFVVLGTELIAELCHQWFGVDFSGTDVMPGPLVAAATPVRCPGHFLSVARNVFSARPNKPVELVARAHGTELRKAVAKWASPAASTAAPVTRKILEAIGKSSTTVSEADRQATLANAMLGLPATLLGSWAKVLRAWTSDRRLWRLQHELASLAPEAGRTMLRAALISTMAADPVADGIWRTVTKKEYLGKVTVEAEDTVWLGLGSAMAGNQDAALAENLLFGGDLAAAPHACPGRGLAVGALTGALTALLLAGELSPMPSQTTLRLKPVMP